MVTLTYVIDLLRDAIWPAFTGGCHYDASQADFSNLFHVYLWAILAAIPLVIHISVPNDSAWIAWISYSLVCGVFFTLSKLVAIFLHWVLDTFAIQEKSELDEEAQQPFIKDTDSIYQPINSDYVSHTGERESDDTEFSTRYAAPMESTTYPIETETTAEAGNNGEQNKNSLNEISSIPSLAVAEVHAAGSKPPPIRLPVLTVDSRNTQRRRPPYYALKHIYSRLPIRGVLRRAHSLSDMRPSHIGIVPRRRVIIAETRLDDVSFLKEPPISPYRPSFLSADNNLDGSLNLRRYKVRPSLPPSMRLHHRLLIPLNDAENFHPTLDEPFSDTEIGGTSLQELPMFSLRSPSVDNPERKDKVITETDLQQQPIIGKRNTQSTPFLAAPAPLPPETKRPNQSISGNIVLDLSRRLEESSSGLSFVKSESKMEDIARFSQTNLPLEVQRELLHRDRDLYDSQHKKTSSSVDDNEIINVAMSSRQDEDVISLKWLFDNEERDKSQPVNASTPRPNRQDRRPSLRAQLADLRTLLGELRLADPESQETDLELHELHRRLERLHRQQRPSYRPSTSDTNTTGPARNRPRLSNDTESSSNTVNLSAGDSVSTPNSFLLNERAGNEAGNEAFSRFVSRGGAPRFSSFERLVTGLLTRQGTLAGQTVRMPGNRLAMSTSALSTQMKRRRVKCRIDKGRLKFDVSLQFDRLSLLAFMDTPRSIWECFLMGFIATLCCFLAGQLIINGFFHDLEFLLIVVVVASCQFSLFKSVQPDPASPVHGFNPLSPYTRPVFFCIIAALLLATTQMPSYWPTSFVFTLWGFSFPPPLWLMTALASFFRVLLLILPILFALGIFTQLNTAAICVLEQLNIHVFGGSGLSSLVGGVASFVRSVFSVLILVPFAYLTLTDREAEKSVWLAVFFAICVPLSYHLSRQPSDLPSVFGMVWASCKRAFRSPRKKKTKIKCKKNAAAECDNSFPVEGANVENNEDENDEEDPEFESLRQTMVKRLNADIIVALMAATLVFSLQVSTLLSNHYSRARLLSSLIYIESLVGFLLHYILPEMRHELPWRFVASPILRSKWTPYAACVRPPKLTAYERVFAIFAFFERNILLVCLLMTAVNSTVTPPAWNSSTSTGTTYLAERFTAVGGAILLSLFAIRAFRQAYCATGHQWVLILFTHLLFNFDLAKSSWFHSEGLLFDLVFTSFIFYRLRELSNKAHFVVVYSAPWQVSWGSVCHALFHPLSLPHSALLVGQTVLASTISAPIQPFMGSVIFLMSYPRPVKFWERTYYTRRLDNSNTRLASQLRAIGDRGPMASQTDTPDNLNSVFYEQIAQSLRKHLAGDILVLGRWGEVSAGDCFILASDHLNALVHIVEIGNGLVTFQLRGLEFRGTYCQQRELEAIFEWPGSDLSCCCCAPGRFPHFLSFNATFQQRWLAWRVVSSKYVLPGYSVAETPAHTLLDSHDLKRLFLSHYVRSLIFYAVQSKRLDIWLSNETVQITIATILSESRYCDLDMSFAPPVSDDYDVLLGGVSLRRFSDRYSSFIRECLSRRNDQVDGGDENGGSGDAEASLNHLELGHSLSHQSDYSTVSVSAMSDSMRKVVALSFMLAVVGRRLLATAARGSLTTTEFLLHGIHSMLKGDLRLTASRDDWVLADIELLQIVVSPAIRLAVRLLQDYFVSGSEETDPSAAYDAMDALDKDTDGLISHEADPQWRSSILAGQSSLTALRQVQDDAAMDDFRLISLRYTQLHFRLVKVNPECVRGLWAGQQQELIFYRNRNSERGSIQNARQVLRNMINSSCDQPLGYPIFVSPLMTSLASDHPLTSETIGPEVDFSHIVSALRCIARRVRVRCGMALLNSSSPQCSAPHLVPKPEIAIELQQQQPLMQAAGDSCQAGESTTCV